MKAVQIRTGNEPPVISERPPKAGMVDGVPSSSTL